MSDDLYLHAILPWEEADLEMEGGRHTCRYCDMPVRKGTVTCPEHKSYYLLLRKKVKRQVRRLLKLARERRELMKVSEFRNFSE